MTALPFESTKIDTGRFETVPLKRVVSKIGSGKTPRGGNETYVSDGVCFLRSQNVHFDGLRLGDVVHIEAEVHREMSSTAVHPRDVLLNITGASLGRAAIVPSDLGPANVNQHVCICRPRKAVLDPRYLLYSLQSRPIQHLIWGNQTGASREGLNFEEVGALPLFVPTAGLKSQKAIANFLDEKTAAIDDLIAKKERLIELLDEKRAALINRAVTKGVDPDVPTKDSGIPWIGEIPATWDVTAIRRVINGIDQGWSPSALDRTKEDDEWAVVKLSAIGKRGFVPHEHKVLPSDVEPDTRYEIRPGDVLLTRANTPLLVGRAVYVDETPPRLLMPDLVYRLRVRRTMNSEFLAYWLRSRCSRYQISRDARGSSQSMVKISQEHIRSWVCPVPPMQAQEAICNRLRRMESELGETERLLTGQVGKLQEYRQSLITSAVTGRLIIETADGEAA